MPETAMDLDGRTVFRKDEVRFTGKVFPMESEPKAEPVQNLPDNELGFRVLPLDAAHVVAADGGFVDITH
jgi:hypothetical protein